MKVLQINSVCGTGSTGRIATDIHETLNVKGHESYIAFGRGEAKKSDFTVKIGDKSNNLRHLIKTRVFDLHGFGSERATNNFIQKVKKIDPDVIHLHNIHGYYLNVESLFNFLKEIDKPVIWTLHDCWAFTGHCAYFDFANCDKWKTECSQCPETKSYPASLFFDNSTLNFHKKNQIFNGVKNLTIVTPSIWLADLLKESFLRNYPVKVINNGIDLITFMPRKSEFIEEHNLKDKFILLGVASTWDRRKGYKYFLEMSKHLNEDEVIILVGLTNEQIKKLPKNIIGINKTNDAKELSEIYSIANVFVNPTLEDNFPTTNLEALACGTPVVTFDTGGSIESVDDSTGRVVRKGDIHELIRTLNKIKNKEIEFDSDSCRRRAELLYNKDKRYLDYINLYFNRLSHDIS
ncbi:glycosyltransferase [Exiguobacterium sp. s157]|uniref:glycosyltransferase n=1 Tax=Exiguobacterium sp. s157 TaxID=2751233 RepID=UPI001BECB850|nr:glycosyltransferase [Exiguobacterium sp. s157]